MKTGLKALLVAAVAAIGLFAGSVASAHCGYGISYGPVWHDTTHVDYHPGGFVPHYDHFDYVPGHYHIHHTGHWHY
jgi:hypothetical protein